MLASSKPIHCFSPLSRKLDVGWPRIEDFQLRGHSCVNNVQRCLCHFYTWMRHSKQTATLLLTKHHANFDTSTSAKGYARVCTNCACAIVVLGILLAQARPTMPCIHLVIYGIIYALTKESNHSNIHCHVAKMKRMRRCHAVRRSMTDRQTDRQSPR